MELALKPLFSKLAGNRKRHNHEMQGLERELVCEKEADVSRVLDTCAFYSLS